MRAWVFLLPVLALGLGTGPRSAPGAPPTALEAGGAAPAGCWAVADGSLARTGSAATRSIRGEVDRAWTWSIPPEVGGSIEEEPRVWHERVYVCVRTAKGEAALFALGTHDGRALLPPLVLSTFLPLDPCVGEHGVLLRSGTDEIRIVTPANGSWITVWGPMHRDGSLSAPLLHAGRVVGQTSGGLAAWHYPEGHSAWSVSERLRGRPAIEGSRVWTVVYDDEGNAHLHSNRVDDGNSARHGFLGHHGAKAPPGDAWRTRIVVNDGFALVHHGEPVQLRTGRISTSLLQLSDTNSGLWAWLAPPACAGPRWLGYLEDEGRKALRLAEGQRDGKLTWWTLAEEQEHPGFFRPELPVTVAGTTAWIGTRAIDVSSRDVVCRLPEDGCVFRPVPAHGLLLVCPTPDRLSAWREDATPSETPVALGAAFDGTLPVATTVADGRILFRGDTVYAGPFDLDPAGTLTLKPAKGKPSSRPLADALVVLEGQERLLHVASPTWLPRHLERLLQVSAREEAKAWTKEAQRTQDVRLLAALVTRALAMGVPEKELAPAIKFLATQPSSPRKVDAKRLASLNERILAHDRATSTAVLAALASGLDDPRPAVRRMLLRHVLDRDPTHEGAVARVRASLPAHVVAREPFVARDWLDERAALAEIPTRKVDVPPEGSRPITPGERELGSARHYWRPDLDAFESDQLLIMTSLKEPDRLAACLGLGELVCTALEDVFQGGTHIRKNRWPIILQLFESEEEYRKFATGSREPESTREWSAGHYDASANVSRIYVPAGDSTLEGVMRTYAHELTHHWIQERCPLFEAREAASPPDSVNWIVEGMAELVESFRWNLAERSWQTFNPQAADLDAFAGAPARTDWKAYFDITAAQFERLDLEPRHKISLRTTLGSHGKHSDLTLFYATAGSVCMYLYHAGAREREALLAYVRDTYTGKVRAGTAHIQERFGRSPTELGTAAAAWARKVVEGEITRKQVFLR